MHDTTPLRLITRDTFISHIHEWHFWCPKYLPFILFADDTIFFQHKNICELTKIVNQELSWFKANKLTMPPDKTKFILFHPFRKEINLLENISLSIDGITWQPQFYHCVWVECLTGHFSIRDSEQICQSGFVQVSFEVLLSTFSLLQNWVFTSFSA